MIHDPETERAVLGCVLGAGAEAAQVVRSTGPLPAEAFTEARRHVWEAMLSMEAQAQPIDHLTLSERLKARGRLADVGGPGALMALDASVPLSHNLPAYVAILRDRMERRQAMAALEAARTKLADLSLPPQATAQSLSSALEGVRGPKQLRRAGALVYEMLDAWERNIEAQRTGQKQVMPTLPWPHEPFGGRMGPLRGKVGVVAGRSGNFKTGLVSDAIWDWGFTRELQGGVMGLEDGCSWFLERLTARRVSVAYEQVGYARLDGGQMAALQSWCAQAYDALEQRVFMEDDKSLGDGRMVSFPDAFDTLQRWADAGCTWAVVDHGLCIDWLKGSGVDRYDMAIGRGLRMCSRLAERTGMAIIFLWHLNRSQDEGSFPTRSDLAESAFLDREARRIDVLWKQPSRPGFQLCTTVKATKGEEGFTAALPLYDAPYGLLGLTKGYVVDFQAEEAERRARAEAERKERKSPIMDALRGKR